MRNGILGGLLAAVALVGAFGLVGGCGAVSLNNDLVSQEQGIKATWRDSQVQYDTFWKTVRETAQVTDKYKEDFREILHGAIEGRYDNQKMVMFIMEQNPNLDSEAYTRLQQIIEAGRNDFARTQRTLVDRQRRYETDLSTFPNSFVAGWMGFPHEVNGEYAPATDVDGDGRYTVLDYRTVTSTKTQEVFRTGREDQPLNVFGE
jgi:hypothetical protein